MELTKSMVPKLFLAFTVGAGGIACSTVNKRLDQMEQGAELITAEDPKKAVAGAIEGRAKAELEEGKKLLNRIPGADKAVESASDLGSKAKKAACASDKTPKWVLRKLDC